MYASRMDIVRFLSSRAQTEGPGWIYWAPTVSTMLSAQTLSPKGCGLLGALAQPILLIPWHPRVHACDISSVVGKKGSSKMFT